LPNVRSRYFSDYAVHLPSADQIGVALDRWKALFGPDALIQHRGKPVKSLIGSWRLTVKAAGLDPHFTPKAMQKLLTRELRRRGVSLDLIGPCKGNTNPPSRIVEAHYAIVDTGILQPVADAIDKLWKELGQMRLVEPIGIEPTTSTVQTNRESRKIKRFRA